ncbi:uncharacterized protein BJ212DRAFT_954634 [Suillus subaureus]|uniref:Uncharacterized protein n=1 Tax=Suillus subaureus TaxID=48587 RepID=A0A9P7AJR5_9AGAM|nr:uncharacterized protein BJ212DRAFT_954634 [Suillus subaureus]KAG1790863.1 hypothetical protein BJ212DRAFT_954634 [Suillus subaureus]
MCFFGVQSDPYYTATLFSPVSVSLYPTLGWLVHMAVGFSKEDYNSEHLHFRLGQPSKLLLMILFLYGVGNITVYEYNMDTWNDTIGPWCVHPPLARRGSWRADRYVYHPKPCEWKVYDPIQWK